MPLGRRVSSVGGVRYQHWLARSRHFNDSLKHTAQLDDSRLGSSPRPRAGVGPGPFKLAPGPQIAGRQQAARRRRAAATVATTAGPPRPTSSRMPVIH